MAEKISKWVKFKRLLKRNMTPTWAKHFAYQVISFVIACLMVVSVAIYAITKSYEGRKLSFVDGFTITAHTGSFDTAENSLESVQAALEHQVDIIEIDIRQRPDGTLVMSHDIVVTNSDGTELSQAFALLADDPDIQINLDIKETRTLNSLYQLLVQYDLLDRAFLTGIETTDLKAIKESDCAGMEYYLNYKPSRIKIFSDDYKQKLIALLEGSGAVGINCKYSYAGGTLSDFLHTKGYKLSVWTVDLENAMKRILVIEPDNITTHKYDELKALISDWGT